MKVVRLQKKQSRMFSFSEDAAHFHYTEVVHLLYSEGTRFDFTETVYLLFSKAARFPSTEVVVHILFPKTAQFHFTVAIHLFSEGSSLWFYRGRQSIFRGRPIFILRRQSNFFFPKRARFHFTAAVTFFLKAVHCDFTEVVHLFFEGDPLPFYGHSLTSFFRSGPAFILGRRSSFSFRTSFYESIPPFITLCRRVTFGKAFGNCGTPSPCLLIFQFAVKRNYI